MLDSSQLILFHATPSQPSMPIRKSELHKTKLWLLATQGLFGRVWMGGRREPGPAPRPWPAKARQKRATLSCLVGWPKRGRPRCGCVWTPPGSPAGNPSATNRPNGAVFGGRPGWGAPRHPNYHQQHTINIFEAGSQLFEARSTYFWYGPSVYITIITISLHLKCLPLNSTSWNQLVIENDERSCKFCWPQLVDKVELSQ